MTSILDTKQFSRAEVEGILSSAEKMEKECASGNVQKLLQDKIVACMFFEPSTRTRLTFETAALKLGAKVISVENAEISSSAFKGESIEDTARMLACYADIIVMRHHKKGMPEAASKAISKPIINAGDGANQHPSQAMLDLYTIKKEHGKLEGLHIAFGGDLFNSRPLYSLVPLLLLYPNNTFYFASPKELDLPEEFLNKLRDKKVNFKVAHSLEEVLPHADVFYMTRVQKERFANVEDYEKVKDLFLLKKEHLKLLNPKGIIMHALPRVNEIEVEIDKDPRAAYFRQAQNGLYTRMALLLYSLGL